MFASAFKMTHKHWGHLLRFASVVKANKLSKKKKKEKEKKKTKFIILSCTQDLQMSSNKTQEIEKTRNPKIPKENTKMKNLGFLKN